jgi:adenylyltransferase/sulfurtransferase
VSSLPVEPGPPLTAEQSQRYSRHLRLDEVGELGQRRLLAATVLVVGAGGLGSPVLSYLAAAGVGRLTIVDDDVVESSNLQRQILHGVDDLGRAKVDSAAEAIGRLNPDVQVRPVRRRLVADNAADLIAGHHLVVDGADNFATRYAVADACEVTGVPEVFGSVLRFDGQVSVFWPGRGPTYRDVFPDPPDPALVPSCAEAGVLGAVPAMVGSAMALEAIKVLTGIGRPLIGRLLVLDALAGSWRSLAISPGGRARASRRAVREVPATAVGAQVGAGARLVDVRGAEEAAIVSIPGAELVPLAEVLSGEGTRGWDRDRPLLLFCKSGARSARAAVAMAEQGFTDIAQISGGIMGWISAVSPSSPRY